MQWLIKLASYLRNPRAGRRFEQELDDELRFHVEMQIEQNIRGGMDPQAARTAAMRRFGGVEQIKERCREQRLLYWFDSFRQDLAFGARSLAKNTGLTTIIVVTLALAIGATTAVFSVIDAVLLQDLPYPDAERLVMLWEYDPAQGIYEDQVSAASYQAWLGVQQSFSSIGVLNNDAPLLREFLLRPQDTGAPWVKARFVSASMFEALGVPPVLGRTFSAEEDLKGAGISTVLSYEFWRREFRGDSAAVGQTLEIGSGQQGVGAWRWQRGFTIVGVMPPDFRLPVECDFWLSYSGHPWYDPDRVDHGHWTVARLKPGVSIAQAEEELSTIQRRQKELHPEYRRSCSHVRAVPLLEQVNGTRTRPALLALFGAVVFVLLIACANVANLLLARGARRRKEIAIRIALGAGRMRVVRQLLTESLMLSFAGGALGVVLAVWGVELLPDFQSGRMANYRDFRFDRFQDVRLDWRVLSVAAMACVGTSILTGLLPALQSTQVGVNNALKEDGRGATVGRRGNRLRRMLLVAEVGLAMVLLIGAGLMLQSFQQLRQTDTGMKTDRVLHCSLDMVMAQRKYSLPESRDVLDAVLQQIRAVPGVESAASVGLIPLVKGQTDDLILDGEAPLEQRPSHSVFRHNITPGLISTLGIPLLAGRDFNEHDTAASQPVILINQHLASRFFPGENPIGKKVMSHPSGWPIRVWIGYEIIGVVGDVRHFELSKEIAPEVYKTIRQEGSPRIGGGTLTIRTTSDPMTLIEPIRHAVEGREDYGRILTDFGSVDAMIDESLADDRFMSLLLSLFAGVAIVLATGGIYGVMSYSTAQRTRDFGIRLALGASRRHVLRLVLGEGLVLGVAGVTCGVAGALAGTRALESQLYGIEPTDPMTYGVLAILLIAVSLLACWLPARRATRIDPAVALRHD
jgi:putative ABC transport system permease protein